MDKMQIDLKNENKNSIKVCCISDTHTFTDQLDVGEGDILIHAGDFTFDGRFEEMKQFVDWFQK